MDYKNLYNRLFFSLLFFSAYFITLNNKYLLFIFGTIIYLIVIYEVLKFFKIFLKLLLFYLFTSFLCFTLYFFIYFDYVFFNIFVFTIIFFDSFSFFSGKLIGKINIFKIISPKKTLEGYIGGILFTNIFIITYFYHIDFEIKMFELILLLNLTIFFSIIGDLIESYFKRKNYIKDSSKFIPGHGGYFDRFDSFIASVIMLTIFSIIFNL